MIHERMRAFVQQQMPAVVAVGLVVDPQGFPALIAVGKRRQIGGQHAGSDEAVLFLHQEAGQPPIGGPFGGNLEVLTPLRHRRVKSVRQIVHLRTRQDVGVQRQVLAGQLANARRSRFVVVDQQFGRFAFLRGRNRYGGGRFGGFLAGCDQVGEGARPRRHLRGPESRRKPALFGSTLRRRPLGVLRDRRGIAVRRWGVFRQSAARRSRRRAFRPAPKLLPVASSSSSPSACCPRVRSLRRRRRFPARPTRSDASGRIVWNPYRSHKSNVAQSVCSMPRAAGIDSFNRVARRAASRVPRVAFSRAGRCPRGETNAP